jgi:hypothetical protein
MSIPSIPLMVVLALVGAVVTADAQPRRPHPRPAPVARPVIVRPALVPWYAPLPYAFYYEQELRKRQHRPRATQSFEGSSPRCPRFFCYE